MKTIRNNRAKFKKSLRKLAKSVIQIGAVGKHPEADMNNNELLTIHEFGGGKVPASAPITKTIKNPKNIKDLKSILQRLIKKNYVETHHDFNTGNILNGVGVFLKNRVKATIKKSLPLEIYKHPDRITNDKTRLANVPLIDTGSMLKSITYGVKAK